MKNWKELTIKELAELDYDTIELYRKYICAEKGIPFSIEKPVEPIAKDKKKLFISNIGDDATEALFKCIKQYNEQAADKGLPNIKVDFNAVRQGNNKYRVECFMTVSNEKE